MKNWDATRGPLAARRDGKPVGSVIYPFGRETYFVQDDELCRSFERHPGIQVNRNARWDWK